MTRRWTTLALALVLLTVGSAWAKTSWVSVKNVAGGDELCLRSGGNDIYYHALSAGDEARCRVSGPRRLPRTASWSSRNASTRWNAKPMWSAP